MLARKQLANALRVLSMDAVQKANSGHPGMPMGMADIAEVLWMDFLKHNPANPGWLNRDRFVVSNGHGSMLLYSLLHLSGYALSMDDIKSFRQLHSKTPGHPEYGMTPGVETTTGPLGQGIGNAVGMALAEKMLAAQFNREGHHLIDHYTYVFTGDGCLMEGISHEVCSLAGTLALDKLIVFWDDNGISIDGKVQNWFNDDTPKRFQAYGWHVLPGIDGHDSEAIRQAVLEARSVNDKPTLICCKTVIGYGAPNASGSHECHGAALGDDEVAATRENLEWTHPPFEMPDDIKSAWNACEKGAESEAHWNQLFAEYESAYPELAAELLRRMAGDLPDDWTAKADLYLQATNKKAETTATRKASMHCLNAFGLELPELIGGSADLSGSNCTLWWGAIPISNTRADGNYIYYGVREFGMSAIMNGLALHGGFIPYGGTFLTFTDYARNAVRMAALMKQRVIFVYTHDSVGLGEDGPTHQPIEHATMLRITPNLSVWRPCDTVETAVAWEYAISRTDGPTSLLLSRQNLPFQQRDKSTLANVHKGAYTLIDGEGTPDAIIIATGSEVALACGAATQLNQQGKNIRVVSMPSMDVFMQQDAAYRHSVLPEQVTTRLAIEAGCSAIWYQFVGLNGKVIAIDSFGESAPAKDVFYHFGFTVDNVINEMNQMFNKTVSSASC